MLCQLNYVSRDLNVLSLSTINSVTYTYLLLHYINIILLNYLVALTMFYAYVDCWDTFGHTNFRGFGNFV